VDGEWSATLALLYEEFLAAIVAPPLLFLGKRVLYDGRKIDSDKEECFWHLITKEDANGERPVDFERAKRLIWFRPILEHHTEPDVHCWRYQEGSGRWRVYLWAHQHDYVIVLEEKGAVYRIVTAYVVEREKVRQSLRKKMADGCAV
jgi:hypothetical protein